MVNSTVSGSRWKGKGHHAAIRSVAFKWIRIFTVAGAIACPTRRNPLEGTGGPGSQDCRHQPRVGNLWRIFETFETLLLTEQLRCLTAKWRAGNSGESGRGRSEDHSPLRDKAGVVSSNAALASLGIRRLPAHVLLPD